MGIQFMDSPLRCPRCGKRMVMDIGEDESEGDAGHVARHECIDCSYAELETGHTMPVASVTGSLLAQIRDRVRAGVEVPMAYDRTLVTVEEALNAPLDV